MKTSFIVLQILEFCVSEPDKPDRIYLIEQAFELWHALVQYTPTITSGLLELFRWWLVYHKRTYVCGGRYYR